MILNRRLRQIKAILSPSFRDTSGVIPEHWPIPV
jgi:hypothetical protein